MEKQETKQEVKTVFEIPSQNMYTLSEKIVALNKKAKRLKCPEITTNILGMQVRKERKPLGYVTLDSAPDEAFGIVSTTYYTVKVLGVSPVLPDWEFLGTLEHATETANILRSVPGFEIPDDYKTGKQKCDHCNKIRNRKDTYMVRNKVSGDVKQVGHNCVADFLGHVSPQQLAMFAQFLKEMEDCGGESFGGSGRERSVSVLEFMEMACALTNTKGFVSRAAAQAYADKAGGHGGINSTGSETFKYLFPSTEMKKSGDLMSITQKDTDFANEVIDFVEAAESNNNFMHNLKVTLSKQFLVSRDAGLAAAAISAFHKSIGYQAERIKKARVGENSNYFGEVGKRAVYTLTVLGEHVFDSQHQFGPNEVRLYRMIDDKGNIATWWTGTGHLEVGHSYNLKGTVKKHDDYKGTKQTVLSRCAVVEDLGKAVVPAPEGRT